MRSINCTAWLRYTYVNVIYMLDATIIREVARAGVDLMMKSNLVSDDVSCILINAA
jgi:hypothetical protein